MDILGTDFEIKEIPVERWKNTETIWVVRRKILGLWWTTLNENWEYLPYSWPDQYSATRYLIDYLGQRKFKRKLNAGRIRIVKHEPYPEGNRILEFSRKYHLVSGFYVNDAPIIAFVGEKDVLGGFQTANELMMKAEISGHKIDNTFEFGRGSQNEDPYPNCIPVTVSLC